MEKPWYLIVGCGCRISDLKDRHVRPIEDFECECGEVNKKFTRCGVDIDDPVLKRLEQLASRGLIGKQVWVTLGLPFMIRITAGFVAAAVYGDLISSSMMTLL